MEFGSSSRCKKLDFKKRHLMNNVITPLFFKLLWPGDSEGTDWTSSQAATIKQNRQ